MARFTSKDDSLWKAVLDAEREFWESVERTVKPIWERLGTKPAPNKPDKAGLKDE